MGTITTGTGLISGLDTKSIIDQLIAIEGKQKDLVQAKVDTATAQKTAYVDLQTRLTSLNITSQQIAKPSFFQNAKATSSDEDVMTATAAAGAAVGSYEFRVAQLVQSEQLVSGNFGDPDKSLVGAGTLTVELGGGQVTQENKLDDLRGGQGVSRGQVRVTDRAGHSTVIDFSDAVTLDDVVKKFNTAVDVSIKASVVNNTLQLTDATGLAAGSLTVQDLGGKTTATDLGVAGTSTATLGGTTTSPTSAGILDFPPSMTATASPTVRATTSPSTPKTARHQRRSQRCRHHRRRHRRHQLRRRYQGRRHRQHRRKRHHAHRQHRRRERVHRRRRQRLDHRRRPRPHRHRERQQLTGKPVIGRLGTVMLKTLNGGNGLTLTSIHVKGRGGAEADVDLSTATTLQDVLDKLNNAGVGIKAEVNNSGNGIQLTDTTGGTGDIVITDNDGGTAPSARHRRHVHRRHHRHQRRESPTQMGQRRHHARQLQRRQRRGGR
ncbi:MAG: flagellar cap protein FliD N-terminal domain-containing protein [Tepidisphaeraceae bacterium]